MVDVYSQSAVSKMMESANQFAVFVNSVVVVFSVAGVLILTESLLLCVLLLLLLLSCFLLVGFAAVHHHVDLLVDLMTGLPIGGH